jgi:hypothetical protein
MNAEGIGQAVVAGNITEAEAVAQLVALGYIEADAREEIYIALGGDDVVLD